MTTTQSDIELTDTKVNDEEETKTAEKKAPMSIFQRVKRFFMLSTVEPFLLCYVFPIALLGVPSQSLFLEKACRTDLNYTDEVCSGEPTNEVLRLFADVSTWKDPLQSGFPAILILFVGAWSDRTGNRKYLMLIPTLGELISSIGLLLANYFFYEWPLWVTALVQAVPSALSGGLSVALMGSYSYISDVTTVEERTFRMGCVAVIATLVIPLGSAVSGVLLEAVGYSGVFSIGAILYAIGLVYLYFRIHDVKVVKTKGTFIQKLIEFFNPKNAWDTLALLFFSPRKELIQIWIVIWAHIVVIGPVIGENSCVYLYTRKKFNMSDVDFSLFTSYQVLMGVAGTALTVTVLNKFLKIHDALLGVIATCSKVLSTFVYGLAPTKTWFFTGPLFDLFGGSGTVAVRSLGTKVVAPDKVGKMCSLIGFVESLLPVIYAPIFIRIYSNTLDTTVPGAYYLVGGVITTPAIFIFLYLYYRHRKQERDVVKDPTTKENYAHENAITIL